MSPSHRNRLLFNADVVTLDAHFRKASWVAVESDKITAIGLGKDWKKRVTKNTDLINCGGKTVVPGFIDAHMHLVSYVKSFVSLDLSPGNGVRSIADIQSNLHKAAQQSPPGSWIFARGYNEFYLAEKRHPIRWDLDLATPNHPVRLMHRSGHACVLNSLALKLAGIHQETGDPDGGWIDRDLTNGEPTGLLYEMSDLLADRIPMISPDDLEKGTRQANQKLVSLGITSIQDASSRNDSRRWELLSAWKKSGCLQPRVNIMRSCKDLKNRYQEHLPEYEDKSHLQQGAVKIVLDQTAGQLHPSQNSLNEIVMQAHCTGMQVAIHAIEEDSIAAACRAVALALERWPRENHRHRIEHCSVCPPALAKQIASLGMTVVSQPPFILYNGDRYLETVPQNQLEHLYPFKTLLSHDIKLAGSSDCPVVPPNPLTAIKAAVSRKSARGRIVGAGEKVSVLEALQMITLNAAYAQFQESTKGSITPGKLADMVVLNKNPLELSADALEDLRVDMTILGGDIIWQKEN